MAKSQLKLTGLVKANPAGILMVRNRIYQRVFVRQWIRSTEDQEHHHLLAGEVDQAREWEGMDRLACVVGAWLSAGRDEVLSTARC